MAWFNFSKKQVLEANPEQLYAQQWAKAAGQEALSLRKSLKVVLPPRACEVALLYAEMRLMAVMVSPKHAPEGLVCGLLESLPRVNKGRFLALSGVDGPWLEQLVTGLQAFYLNLPTGQILVFLEPQLYDSEPVHLVPSVLHHPLPYFLLAPRMKQGHKVASFMAHSLKYSTNWQEPMSALLEVTLSYQGATACYYVVLGQAAQRKEIWQKVLPVLVAQAGRHTKASWQIELISRWIEPAAEALKGFVYEGMVRYSEPYEVNVSLIIPTTVLQLWIKALSTPAQRKQVLPTGSTVLMLFQWLSALTSQAQTLKPLWRGAATGSYGMLTSDKTPVSVPELLRIIETKDAKLIIENVLLARHSAHLNALLSYKEKGEQKGQALVRWGAADWFKSDFMQYLPVRLRSEWEHQQPSLSLKEWQEFNRQVLFELIDAMAQGRIELTAGTWRMLQQLVIEPQQRYEKELFEQQFKAFYGDVWSNLSLKKRSFLVQKLNNRQWALILVCRSQLLSELYPHISRRRALYLEEELEYLKHSLQVDYAGARHSMALLMQHK